MTSVNMFARFVDKLRTLPQSMIGTYVRSRPVLFLIFATVTICQFTDILFSMVITKGAHRVGHVYNAAETAAE